MCTGAKTQGVPMLSHNIGVDLGTANTVIVTARKGIVLDEPSVVAFQNSKGKRNFLAVGEDAKLMLGKTPQSIVASQPLSDGVIADFDYAETMIKQFFKKATPRSRYLKLKTVVCVPFGATPVEKRAIQQAIKSAGASSAGLLEEPMAAALGANLPVLTPKGSMVVDIGGGTTEIAVVALGGIVEATSIKTGGNHFDLAIIQSVKKRLNLHIGGATAEQIKLEIGSANCPCLADDKEPLQISGVGSTDGIPKSESINQHSYSVAVKPLIDNIEIAIRNVLERTPPDLASDVYEYGITLTGGGCLLKDLDIELTRRLKIRVVVAENPKYCVAYGAARAVQMGKKFVHAIEYDV
jgi:rod shape-determining protein MreB